MSPAPSAKAPFSHPDPETPPLKVVVDPGLVEPAADPTVGRLADTRMTANSRLAAASAPPRGRIFWFLNFKLQGSKAAPFFLFLAPRAEVAPSQDAARSDRVLRPRASCLCYGYVNTDDIND